MSNRPVCHAHSSFSGVHDQQVRRAATRMVLVLAAMLLFVGARCAILWFDFFVGAPFTVKYYVAYMVAEVLPLLPVLALVTIAFYARREKNTSSNSKKNKTVKSDSYTSSDGGVAADGTSQSVPLLADEPQDNDYNY